ncbi:MAG: restriction endonuclease subunit S [Coprococcus sp.]
MAKPKIRFKGYTDEWEQRKLGDDLVSIHTGTNLLGSITNTGMPLIKMGNIQRGYFDTSKVEFLAENEQPDKADIVNYGDFFFNTRNTLELVGKGATWMKNSGEYAFNSNIARFELRNLDTIFFNYLYNTDYMTKQIHARAMGTTSVAAIYPSTLDSVEYLAPCMKEQQKIGAYFKQLDHLITLHQRKCEQAKKLKKYMLQKMFPQNGQKVPEIRFKGFTDDWEQRKFSDCYKMSSGYAFKMSDYCDEGVGLINGESIQHGIINDDNLNHLPESFVQHYPDFLLKENDIVVGLNRPITNGNLKIARIPSKYNDSLLYQRAGKIVYKTDCDKDFTYVLLSQEILKHTLVEAVGSDQPFISTSKLDGWKMMMPSDIEEQVKIGEYFQKLDYLITLHQQKCDELKNIKKFMLQNMFM